MVSKREGFGLEVPIEYLGSSRIPLTIRLVVSGDRWVGWRFTTTPPLHTHIRKKTRKTHTLECKKEVQKWEISHLKNVETRKIVKHQESSHQTPGIQPNPTYCFLKMKYLFPTLTYILRIIEISLFWIKILDPIFITRSEKTCKAAGREEITYNIRTPLKYLAILWT